MRVLVQTRGRLVDYEFLGSTPAQSWWSEYRDHTAFERPTIILRSRDAGWEAYLGAIPSGSRTDLAGRTIRFTLVLEGGSADLHAALALIEAWLAGIAAGDGHLAAALDRAFDEPRVERMLAGAEPDARRDEEVDGLVADVLEELAPELGPAPAAVPVAGTVFGSARRAGDRARFLGHAAAILGGAPGRALLLNLVHSRADAEGVAAEHRAGGATAVLVTEPRSTARRTPVRRSPDPASPAAMVARRASEPPEVCRISILGPPGVGTTTLVSAIVLDGRRMLAGRRVALRAADEVTREALAANDRALDEALRAGEVVPGGFRAAAPAFTFRLLLGAGGPGAGVRLDLLHVPVHWFAPDRPAAAEEEWERCRRFIAESSVLLVPVDATVLMETWQKAHTAAVPSILATPLVADVARVWAQERRQRPDEPALLLLCPLKCESYFADNGGLRDRSDELRKRVRETYAEVLAAVRQEVTEAQARAFCCPIDTIGCVEVQRARWIPTGGQPAFAFEARYRVRDPPNRSVRGVDDLFGRLCEDVVETRQRAARQRAETFVRADAPSELDLPRVVLRGLEEVVRPVWRAGGADRPEGPHGRDEEAARRREAVDRVLRECADRPLSERASGL